MASMGQGIRKSTSNAHRSLRERQGSTQEGLGQRMPPLGGMQTSTQRRSEYNAFGSNTKPPMMPAAAMHHTSFSNEPMSAQPKKTGITSAAARMCKANNAYKAYKEAYKAYYKSYYEAYKEDTQDDSPPRTRTKQKFYKGFILA